jgi:CRISPR-associated protein Cmr2
MDVYYRKLYALLHHPERPEWRGAICQQLNCLQPYLEELHQWWEKSGYLSAEIGSSSDRVNLKLNQQSNTILKCKHPISGQSQTLDAPQFPIIDVSSLNSEFDPKSESDIKKLFWWFWRFYPEKVAQSNSDALLLPAHKILPDCPQHSYNSTVSALAGAMFPENLPPDETYKHPYLLIFTFSPVQEFIKSSRKFLDFWSGSYLLHYLSVKLCWFVGQEYGPDAVITPSLWKQEIIDALLLTKYCDFTKDFGNDQTPVDRFQNKTSSSLSTAGFPNVITVLVPGETVAQELGKQLSDILKTEWKTIAEKVKAEIKDRVMREIAAHGDEIWDKIQSEFPSDNNPNPYYRELNKWQQSSCWEWNKLWNAQIDNTWESYWSAIPLGNPEVPLEITRLSPEETFLQSWKDYQKTVAQPRTDDIPTLAEELTYTTLNVGTWWGSLQARLGQSIQAVKNTRNWQIASAPGERSTLSGQFSAVHPNLLYNEQFCEGGGLPGSSMRLFWRVLAEVYPCLFNGSEKLNAIELTKRMSWVYGGVAESLGVKIAPNQEDNNIHSEQKDYESFIRFPNLSSIAAARFAHDHPTQVQDYWNTLNELIKNELPQPYRNQFAARTRGRPFQIGKTDKKLNPNNKDGQDYNGIMFSSKWLAEDLNLSEKGELETLRRLVDQAHKNNQFGEGSPADWWVIVLADGDGMGKYVSGAKLKPYEDYIIKSEVDEGTQNSHEFDKLLKETKKRMGPASHVGLNRALLDFSNQLVPYLTEKRFCGKVVYSGGDDVMAVLPLADLPEYLLSLRAAWCGAKDPFNDFDNKEATDNLEGSGYWHPLSTVKELAQRPHFTMGKDATMSMGIVIAYKSVPLPTVLESLWTAEKERAKKIPGKDGLCFRVIYGGGNTLEAVMKGHLLESWWNFIQQYQQLDLSPALYRLAEELPRRACVTENDQLFSKAAQVILKRRDESKNLGVEIYDPILNWLNAWEDWVKSLKTSQNAEEPLGTQPEDVGRLLRFSAFWVDKMVQQQQWGKEEN